MADHLHDGHRARMRERYLRGGLSGLEPHEMLEMLLYHAVPRADTNPTAHALLNTFGSLSGVMSAPPTALRKVDGMTDNAVTMLLFLRDYFRTLHAERLTGTPLDSFAAVKAFFSEIYAFDSVETVRAALLDQKLCLRGVPGHHKPGSHRENQHGCRQRDAENASAVPCGFHGRGFLLPSVTQRIIARSAARRNVIIEGTALMSPDHDSRKQPFALFPCHAAAAVV